MNWTALLTENTGAHYHAAEGLVALCDDAALGWKPATGTNWMTQGQLLQHLAEAGGTCIAGFVTGKWPMPADATMEDMLPPAEKLPTVKSVAEARKALLADRALALGMIVEAGEERLSTQKLAAPWDPTPRLLGAQCLSMLSHLATHKAQLFYYMKLQGKPVHTGHLYGM